MITEPIRHIAQPSFPSVPSSSFKKYAPSTALLAVSMSPTRGPNPRARSPDQHAESAQRRHKDGRRKGVSSKVGNLAHDLCTARSVVSAGRATRGANAARDPRVTIPPHHIGLRR